MSDILADYHEWLGHTPESIVTHSDRCHMYHERCMIHRLAAEVERLRMTDKERDAMEFFADLPWARESNNATEAAAIRGFLDRHARETVGG